MTKYARNKAVLVKLETIYGTDPTPTGAANAMQVTNFRPEPIVGQDIRRDLLLPYMGHQGVILTGNYGRVSFDVELAGSGTAGAAPAWGGLLQACGMAETEDPLGLEVTYNPISTSHKSVAIYYFQDGIRHVLLGARGTFKLAMQPGQIPRLSFTL